MADTPAPTSSELIATAQRAAMGDIDDFRRECDHRTVAEWIADVVGPRARSIRWSAGRCELVIPESPRDAGGTGAFCAQARVLARNARRAVTLEFYMERSNGRLRGYAFRAAGDRADGWEDYMRFTTEFEATWRRLQRLPAVPNQGRCERAAPGPSWPLKDESTMPLVVFPGPSAARSPESMNTNRRR